MPEGLFFNAVLLALGIASLWWFVHARFFRAESPWVRADATPWPFLFGAFVAWLAAPFAGMLLLSLRHGEDILHDKDIPKTLSLADHALVVAGGESIAALAAAALWIVIRRVEQIPVNAHPPRVPACVARGIAWGVPSLFVTAAVGAGASVLVTLFSREPPPTLAHDVLPMLTSPDAASTPRAFLILGVVLVAPVYEEIVYRGLLLVGLARLTRAHGHWPAVAINATLFALVHLSAMPTWRAAVAMIPTLFTLGLLLAHAHLKSRSIVVPITMHALFNAANVAAAFYLVR